MLHDTHGVAVRQNLTGPAIDNFAAALPRALDVVVVVARQNQDRFGTRNGLIAAVERATIRDVQPLAIGVVAIENEIQTFGSGLDFVDRAAARPSMLIVARFGIELPGSEKRVGVRSHKLSLP